MPLASDSGGYGTVIRRGQSWMSKGDANFCSSS
jgi:hypothetical protein